MNVCAKCGYCCTVAPCIYGRRNNGKRDCDFLGEPDEFGRRDCLKYSEIFGKEMDYPMPMFGCGCSSPMFNTVRCEVIRKMEKKGIF